ncbi:thioredoxin family protein [Listeria marthii]|uniref:thioredoxin family protein n=1 Tax=Listeria marthii TaxID=529731 RepID=UPI0002D9194F|nr:thioredoxin family protein [Listeria marthii]MBF2364128.1 thioredoxin family protein [Listeria marthii]MBF2479550.1 thioredoxin family protein [Listeria marthii]MBF2496161.1 thioredoxin family protein [Listeria marthii]
MRTAQKNGADFVVFFFTPMCGSCQVASRLVDVVLEADGINYEVAKVDLNYVPDIAQTLEITSVPALVKFKNGQPADLSYQLHDATAIFEFLYSK